MVYTNAVKGVESGFLRGKLEGAGLMRERAGEVHPRGATSGLSQAPCSAPTPYQQESNEGAVRHPRGRGTRLQSRDVGDMRDSDRVTKAGARITRYVTINVNMGYIDNT